MRPHGNKIVAEDGPQFVAQAVPGRSRGVRDIVESDRRRALIAYDVEPPFCKEPTRQPLGVPSKMSSGAPPGTIVVSHETVDSWCLSRCRSPRTGAFNRGHRDRAWFRDVDSSDRGAVQATNVTRRSYTT
jgi:hypothetical protein